MDLPKPQSTPRFTLGKQSSLKPNREDLLPEEEEELIDPRVRLMYLANEGDVEGIKELLDSGTNVNFSDIDGRTALHVATCQGFTDVVQLLLDRGAEVDTEDRWGSTPLADAIYYKNHNVIKLLEEHGAKPPVAPMHVQNTREIPEYEIDPRELDFSNSVDITKGTFRIALWRGIQVAVKTLGEELFTDEDKVTAFRDELALLQKIRHPNVVQFLGAVTQSSPMMIVTEYLPKKRKNLENGRKSAEKLQKDDLPSDLPKNLLQSLPRSSQSRNPEATNSSDMGSDLPKKLEDHWSNHSQRHRRLTHREAIWAVICPIT